MLGFIAQEDMECARCGAEIPRGAHIYIGDESICEDCYDEEMKDN